MRGASDCRWEVNACLRLRVWDFCLLVCSPLIFIISVQTLIDISRHAIMRCCMSNIESSRTNIIILVVENNYNNNNIDENYSIERASKQTRRKNYRVEKKFELRSYMMREQKCVAKCTVFLLKKTKKKQKTIIFAITAINY